ncbi:hypothetical protein H7347_02215 [Corynebacterium sp. zg-331]|uniref:hypothetical protein n=1 Tax=unclassified Corynebacterium TaxID=2624378 RepID=UPI00128B68B1|nr:MULTISPECIES: hypothetical protein [unclassified Corynebacterium]MBC3185402.1 hypothetical protein [Corynebacterium sp. zg-331]MPV51897.1 hypothetical protein [Corynebacterium sp. zg331]
MTYPSTPHPEDSPGFDKYPQYPQEISEWAQERPARGTGKIDVMAAVPWGFKSVFRSWYIWILGSLVLLLVGAGASVAMSLAGMDDTSVTWNAGWSEAGLSMVQFFIMPFLLTGLLAQVNKKRIGLGDFFRDVHYLRVLVVSLVQTLLCVLGIVAVVVPVVVATMSANAESNVGVILGVMGVLVLLSILISPFFVFWNWYAADGHGVKESIVLGLKAGKRNYLALLVFSFVGGLAIVVGMIATLTLGVVILLPAYYLVYAHMFRQASQGALPTE